MRLPLSKTYRAFRELDDLSDEQCERLLDRVRFGGRYELAAAAAVGMTLLATLATMCSLGRFLDAAIDGSMQSLARGDEVTLLIVMSVSTGIPAVSALLVRDLVLRAYMRSALAGHIHRTRCPECRYVLLGQRVNGGIVTCPECGFAARLAVLGISAGDLVPPVRGVKSGDRQ